MIVVLEQRGDREIAWLLVRILNLNLIAVAAAALAWTRRRIAKETWQYSY